MFGTRHIIQLESMELHQREKNHATECSRVNELGLEEVNNNWKAVGAFSRPAQSTELRFSPSRRCCLPFNQHTTGS